LPTEDRYKRLTQFQKVWIIENIIQDNKEEKRAFEAARGTNSFGNDEASYEEFIESIKASRRK
jgi:hypothetical protein